MKHGRNAVCLSRHDRGQQSATCDKHGDNAGENAFVPAQASGAASTVRPRGTISKRSGVRGRVISPSSDRNTRGRVNVSVTRAAGLSHGTSGLQTGVAGPIRTAPCTSVSAIRRSRGLRLSAGRHRDDRFVEELTPIFAGLHRKQEPNRIQFLSQCRLSSL